MKHEKEEHFLNMSQKRIKTTMIGAIDKFEKNFGYLWGHFKDGDLTEQQEKFADLWDFTRNQILNQGNHQIRHLKDDYDIMIGKFKTTYTQNYTVNSTEER